MNARLDQRPRLSRAARLRFDPQTDCYVLLSPERGLRLNASATEVVQRCTGEFTVQEIVRELLKKLGAAEPAVSAAQVTEDVLNLLLSLSRRRLVVFEPCP